VPRVFPAVGAEPALTLQIQQDDTFIVPLHCMLDLPGGVLWDRRRPAIVDGSELSSRPVPTRVRPSLGSIRRG